MKTASRMGRHRLAWAAAAVVGLAGCAAEETRQLAGDDRTVERDPTSGAVTARGIEHQEFKVETSGTAPDSELAKLRRAADSDLSSAEDEAAQRKALQDAADEEAAEAPK